MRTAIRAASVARVDSVDRVVKEAAAVTDAAVPRTARTGVVTVREVIAGANPAVRWRRRSAMPGSAAEPGGTGDGGERSMPAAGTASASVDVR